MNKFPEIWGLPDSVLFGGRFLWRCPGSSGAMSFEVLKSELTSEGWTLHCVDGNGREFTATGEYNAEAMHQAMGLAMGLDANGKLPPEPDEDDQPAPTPGP